MSLSFSERYGYKEVRNVFQIEEMDEVLKIGIWNAMRDTCFKGYYDIFNQSSKGPELVQLCRNLWVNFFKERINLFPENWFRFENVFEDYIFEDAVWHEIYDLLEFIAENIVDPEEFKVKVNNVLEREMSGYRFVGNEIAPIVNEVEIQSIEEAINNSNLRHVTIHIESALRLMSDRKNPSYRNSIKESISAVEGVAKLITKERNVELKPALGKLDELLSVPLHGALKAGFLKIYGYTSDGDGIRHALTESSNVSFEDAKFMLIACSAFVNYLISKAELAGIEI